jgi:hypothetical protein
MEAPMTITPEQKRAVDEAGELPVRVEDPETKRPYVIVREEVYDKLWTSFAADHSERSPQQIGELQPDEVPEGLRLAQEAFFRDLPVMLKDRNMLGKWVAYHRDQRIAVGRREGDVLAEVVCRKIPGDEFCTFIVRPQSPAPEEVDYPSSWL